MGGRDPALFRFECDDEVDDSADASTGDDEHDDGDDDDSGNRQRGKQKKKEKLKKQKKDKVEAKGGCGKVFEVLEEGEVRCAVEALELVRARSRLQERTKEDNWEEFFGLLQPDPFAVFAKG